MTNLDDYRNRKQAARDYHPSVRPIWTPADSVATAQAFNAELDHAEKVEPQHRTVNLTAVSRERRARVMDAMGREAGVGVFATDAGIQHKLTVPGMRSAGVYVLQVERDTGETQQWRSLKN